MWILAAMSIRWVLLLYELLTGTTPFDRDRMSSVSFDEFRRIVKEEDPPRPQHTAEHAQRGLGDGGREASHRSPHTGSASEIRGELDWIVMKALEKDRTRRYESANELAKDVQRYLDDEAVEACPQSASYRLKKFARRNKAVLVTISAVAVALVFGLGIATWQAFVATEAKQLAEQRLDEVDEQRQLAEDNLALADSNFQMAFDAVDKMLTEVASDQLKHPQARHTQFALDHFRRSAPDEHPRTGDHGGLRHRGGRRRLSEYWGKTRQPHRSGAVRPQNGVTAKH
jgi:hypothetical protein